MTKPKAKRDKHTELPDGGADIPADDESAQVAIVATRKCGKLNPARGGGAIEFQIGRIGAEIFLRLLSNEGSGRHSREFVPLSRVRACFSPGVLAGQPFKANLMSQAFRARSTTNSGFITAVLRAEGLAVEDPEHKGMSLLCGDFDEWAEAMRTAEPEKNGDGSVKMEPLVPPKRENPFAAAKDRTPKKSGGKRRESAADVDEPGIADGDATDAADAEPCMVDA